MMTTYHVVDGAGDVKVIMPDGREYDIAGVAAVNRAADLVLLKVKTAGVPFLDFWDGDPPRVGAPVVAIGNAEGVSNSVSKGQISGLLENGYGEVSAIQTTVPISQAATGGPLLTKSGLVIGVTTTPATDGQNISLAAPSREIVRLIARRGDLRSLADLAAEQGEAQEAQTIDQAIAQIYAGDPVQALLMLQRIPEEHRENWRYWFATGFAHETQKKPDLADSDFDKAVQLKPDSANAWLIMGTAFLQRAHPELAAPCFTKAIELDPATLPAYAGLARSQHRNGQPAEAIATCKRGLDIIPGNAELLLVLGSCQAATGNRAEARAAFKQVIDPATHASAAEQQFAQESLRELGNKP
jgi:Flp pilus assembly protein TadD